MGRRTGAAVVVSLALAGGLYVLWPGPQPQPDPPPPVPPTGTPPPAAGGEGPGPIPPTAGGLTSAGLPVDRLVSKGWPSEAAERVLEFHAGWLEALRRHDPAGYDRTLTDLGQFPSAAAVGRTLTRRPELAGLLVMAGDHATDLADALDRGDAEDDLLAGLFLAHLTPDDVKALAAALPGNRNQIAALTRRGLVGAEVLYLFDRSGPAGREYAAWLWDEVRRALGGPDDELADVFVFLLAEGPEIRRRLADDGFRQDFRRRWDALRGGAARIGSPLPELAGLPGVWDFLARGDARELLERRGVLAVDLLAGDRAYPPEVRDRVAALLRAEGETIARLLDECRGEAAFRELLRGDRPVPAPLLLRVAADLPAHPDRAARLRTLADRWARDRTGEALRRALAGPADPGAAGYLPGYSLYRLVRTDPDDIGGLDVLFAAADVASVVMPAAKVGTELGKAGAKKAANEVAKKAIREAAERAAKEAVEVQLRRRAAALAGRVVVNRASAWAAAGQRCREAAAFVRDVLAGKTRSLFPVAVDVTGAVRFAFRLGRTGGLGRHTFRRLAGLEARLFMRGDARLTLKLGVTFNPKGGSLPALVKLLKAAGEWVEKDGRAEPRPPDPGPAGGAPPAAEPPRDAWAKAAGAVWLAAAVPGLLPDDPDGDW